MAWRSSSRTWSGSRARRRRPSRSPAPSGESVTLTPRWERDCYSEGSLSFLASDDQGRRATHLGAGPFTYDVALTLDGTTYHGLGTWPNGETEDIAPHVPLTWTPELPAYEG